MNDKGQIVGELIDSDGLNQAFIWLPQADYGLSAGMNLLDAAVNFNDPGIVGTVAYDINDSGLAVGRVTTGTPPTIVTKPMIWDLAAMNSSQLDLPGSAAWAVNDDSIASIVGGAEIDHVSIPVQQPVIQDAFLYEYGMTLYTLPTFGDRAAVAFAVTDMGSPAGRDVVGFQHCVSVFGCLSGTCTPEVDGARWPNPSTNAGMLPVIDPSLDGRVVGRAMNNSNGFIVGFGDDPNDNCRVRALFWKTPGSVPTLLPTLPGQPQDADDAFDIRETQPNGDLEVVGRSVLAERALLWRGGVSGSVVNFDSTPIDLNDVAQSPSDFAVLRIAEAINSDGWIAGWGELPSSSGPLDTNAFVVTPLDDYSSGICIGDLANDNSEGFPDGVVDIFDLLYLLAHWGASQSHADMTGDGVVDVFDMLDLLSGWGDCALVPVANTVLSLEDEMLNAGLTMDDWDEFEYVMTNSNDEDEKENYRCWMQRLLSACALCPPCPDTNPFR